MFFFLSFFPLSPPLFCFSVCLCCGEMRLLWCDSALVRKALFHLSFCVRSPLWCSLYGNKPLPIGVNVLKENFITRCLLKMLQCPHVPFVWNHPLPFIFLLGEHEHGWRRGGRREGILSCLSLTFYWIICFGGKLSPSTININTSFKAEYKHWTF